jgi:hypothetical protein
MELYLNSRWTKLHGNAYIAEALAWSDNGNHATIFATGDTTDEANAKLIGALREFKLLPEAVSAEDQQGSLKEDSGNLSEAS